MFADVGSEHGAHTEFLSGEVAREAADVERGDCGTDCVRAIFQRAVGLREEARDETRERVARTGGAESGVACRVDEHATVGCGDVWARAFENKDNVIGYGKLTR